MWRSFLCNLRRRRLLLLHRHQQVRIFQKSVLCWFHIVSWLVSCFRRICICSLFSCCYASSTAADDAAASVCREILERICQYGAVAAAGRFRMVSFRKRGTNYRALLWKMTYKDKQRHRVWVCMCVYVCVCVCVCVCVFVCVGSWWRCCCVCV